MCAVIVDSIEMADICSSCKKRVNSGDRRTSLGKQWHRECLRCDECKRVLNPGQHAEHKGMPYCHHPCYQLRFGAITTTVKRPVTSYSDPQSSDVWKKPTPYRTLQKQHILDLIKTYNSACQENNKTLETLKKLEKEGALETPEVLEKMEKVDEVRFSEKDDGLVMEVKVRVFWHVSRAIQLLDSDASRITRHSVSITSAGAPTSSAPLMRASSFSHTLPLSFDRGQGRDVGAQEDDVVMRPSCQQVHYYRRSINGHRFVGPSQVTLPKDTKTMIRITNDNTTDDVIQILLHKFQVNERSDDFGLFMICKDGYERRLMPNEIPLLEKLSAGPTDKNAKFILKEKNANKHLSEGVHELMAVSTDLLLQMIAMLEKEEEEERAQIKMKYSNFKSRLLAFLSTKESAV